MGDQKEEDLYRNFSRKDLQGLCKKYGLPAKKSNSEMATSLILYLEQKNLSTRAIWEGTRSDLFASGTKELQTVVRMNSMDDQRKDCGRIASHNSVRNQWLNHRDAQLDNLQNSKESATSDKASVDVGDLTQLHRESNSGTGVPENPFSSVTSVVIPPREFTFESLDEDGIQLYVDLNSSPADWIESLKSGVQINSDVYQPKSQSFHEDIGILHCPNKTNGSVTVNPSMETDNDQLLDGSYPTTKLTCNMMQDVELDEREGSLSSPGLSCLSNAVHNLGNLQEEQAYLSSSLEPGTEWQLPGANYCRREKILTANSDVNVAVQTRMCADFTGNSVPSDSRFSDMPAHQGARTGNGVYKKLSLQKSSNCSLGPVLNCIETSTVLTEMLNSNCATISRDIAYSPSVGRCVNVVDKLKKTEVAQSELIRTIQTPSTDDFQMRPAREVGERTAVSPVLNSLPLNLVDNRSKVDSEHIKSNFFRKSDRQIREAQSHSAENAGLLRTLEASNEADKLPKKDASLYPSYNDGSFEVVVPKIKELEPRIPDKFNELQEEISRSPSTPNGGDLGNSDIGNGNGGSRCLNSNNLMEKLWKKSSDSESNGENKKRKLNSVEHQSKEANTEAKILRSSKQFDGDGHSKRRRSSRLFTK